jgi:hypothetical protein
MNYFIEKYNGYPYQKLFTSKNLLNIMEYNNSIILDLFDTLISIVYHDLFTDRVEGRKVLRVEIPVQNYGEFKKIKNELESLVVFMTGGERWDISFSKTKDVKSIIINHQGQLDTYQFDSIALISAGLDSMAGVSEEIANERKTLFITSYAKKENKKLYEIYKDLKGLESSKIVTINKYPIDGGGNIPLHSNQRTRSLAFIANTLLYAEFYGICEIKMYENGIMSLNPTFDSRRGVTKTTHHKTIFLLNTILRKLNLNFKVINPFRFKTKKEVISLINKDLRIKIKETRTCSKGNVVQLNTGGRNGAYHCGVCIACILRIISMHNLELEDAPYITGKYEKCNDSDIIEKRSYTYHEKKSLIEYYKRFKKEIDGESIFDYLDGIHKKYFDDDELFIDKLDSMLRKFSAELHDYVSLINYD